jgi:cell division protein FtsW
MARNGKAVQTGGIDVALVMAVAALLAVGLVMVYSTTYALGFRLYGDPNYFLIRQGIWVAVGAAVLLVMTRIQYTGWQRISILVMAGMLLLLAVLLIFGGERFGGRRWFFGGSVQPSELAKLAVVIYIADWLSSKGEQIRDVTYGLIPFAILIGVVTGLILLQPDFSTSMLIAATAFAMFFVAGAEVKQLAISFLVGGLALAILILQAPYRLERIAVFLDPMSDPSEEGYQIVQTLRALVRGGVTGQGLGNSQQKLGALPAAHTDAIFAVLGEELGLIGGLVVIGLFAILAYRGFRIAQDAPDTFGMMLATGVTAWLAFQALINIAVVTSTMPFTGIPLPFISFGGSSLVTSMAGVGLLLNISKYSAVERDARTPVRRRDRGARLPSLSRY